MPSSTERGLATGATTPPGVAPGRLALVTGSSGGIGACVVARLAAAGCTVVGADLQAGSGQQLAGFFDLDVTDEVRCGEVVREVIARYGPLDTLVHAAGVLGTTPDPFETTTAEFARVMAINAGGTFSMVREVGRAMRESGQGGAIVVFSSVAAKEARRDYMPYNASKLAVLHIMWSMAQLLGPSGVSVNAVTPGPVNTAMWAQKAGDTGAAAAARAARAAELPMGRFAEPDEVASAVAYLADPANRYLTGVSLDVAGGAHLGMGT